jgi:hypothetical protein
MELVGNITLGDLQKAYGAAQALEARPLRLVGRLAGLGSSELDAGVPTWAWVAIAFGAGATVSVLYSDRLRRKVGDFFR